jgi:putative nucleotidyltransferase with HDIG domain
MSNINPGSYEIILKRIRDIPSLPDVVTRILAVIGKATTPASEIARLISYDPGLTSKVLRMVNSAAYGFQRQISSIQHGIMILGFNNVRGLVLSASIFKLFEGHTHPGGLNHNEFWEHSLSTAVAARVLAKELRVPDADDIFSAAMLHDIGKVVLDIYFQQDYQAVMEQARRLNLPFHGREFYELEQRLLGITHTSIGSFLATKWKLPVTFTEVIQFHHEPEKAQSCGHLVYLVALANEMSVIYQQRGLHYQREHFSPKLLDYFDMPDDTLLHLMQALAEEMLTAQDLLTSIASDGPGKPGKLPGR